MFSPSSYPEFPHILDLTRGTCDPTGISCFSAQHFDFAFVDANLVRELRFLQILVVWSKCVISEKVHVACSSSGQAKVRRLRNQALANDLLNLNESNALHKEKINEGLRGIGGFGTL